MTGQINLRSLVCLPAVLALLATPCLAQEPAPQAAQPAAAKVPFSKSANLRYLEDVFGVDLAGTNPKKGIELSISPRFVDTVRKDYFRVPVRFKYGITDNWEAGVRLQPYFNNSGKGKNKNGVENIRFSTKYRLREPLFEHYDSAVGLRITLPLEDEKDGITDGYRHYTPFATVSRTYDLSGDRQLQWFTSAEVDFLAGSPDRQGRSDKDNRLGLFPGLIYGPPSFWRYVFYVEWDTNRIDGGHEDDVYLVPGVLLDPPKDYISWLPGDWEFEFGGKIGLVDASNDHSVIFKVKFDFASIMKRAGYDRWGER